LALPDIKAAGADMKPYFTSALNFNE